MPRYLVERTFSETVTLPGPVTTEQDRLLFIENNGLDGVTWIYSYLASDSKTSYCIYDAPSPEAIRRASRRNGIPITRIIEVAVLDPYSYRRPPFPKIGI
jgi:hypothetical protein